jgi:hypothetical protein
MTERYPYGSYDFARRKMRMRRIALGTIGVIFLLIRTTIMSLFGFLMVLFPECKPMEILNSATAKAFSER